MTDHDSAPKPTAVHPSIDVTIAIPTHGGKVDVTGSLVIQDDGVGRITIKAGDARLLASHLETGTPCAIRNTYRA